MSVTLPARHAGCEHNVWTHFNDLSTNGKIILKTVSKR